MDRRRDDIGADNRMITEAAGDDPAASSFPGMSNQHFRICSPPAIVQPAGVV